MTIYRGIEKINQEVTIEQYDGIARPGEVVTAQIDPSAPDFAAYLADANGNLHPLGGGGGNGSPGGLNGQVQFNSLGNFGGSANLTFDTGNAILTTGTLAADQLSIGDDGTPGEYFLNVDTANGITIGMTAAQTMTVGANGILIGGTGGVRLTGAASSNVVLGGGTTGAVSVQSPIALGTVGNVKITGGSNGQMLTTDGTGNLSWTTASGGGAVATGFQYAIGNAQVSGQAAFNSDNPAQVSQFSLNPTTGANVDIDPLVTYFTGKDVIAKVNDVAGNQASFDIGTVSTLVESYNGYKAAYTSLWDDDPGFCKIAIYKDTANATITVPSDTNNDQFTIDLDNAVDQVALIVLYTQNSSFVPSKANLYEYFQFFVDTILIPAAGNISTIRTTFYDQLSTSTAMISAWGENPYNLEFYTNNVNSRYQNVSQSATSGAGTGFEATSVIIAGDGTYRIVQGYNGGTGFAVADTITFDGSQFGGTSGANDLVLTVTTVDAGGIVTGFTSAGTTAAVWPTDYISDGGDDQYDTGNFLQTNQQSPVPYSDGVIQNSGAFGGNEWFVGYAYGQFIFVGDNTNYPVNSFGTYGETGSDGNGQRVTGDLTPVLEYTFNVDSVLDASGSLDLSAGNVTVDFDIAGNDTNGVVFDRGNVNTITTSAGDLYLRAADDIRIQATDFLSLRGGSANVPSNGGGDAELLGGDGGQAITTVGTEQPAGQGGAVSISGGQAGGDNGNASLGASGGQLTLSGGAASGTQMGGSVYIRGGYGTSQELYGNIVIEDGSYSWVFDSTGNLTTNGNLFATGNITTTGTVTAATLVGRITPRIVSEVTTSTVLINGDVTDQYNLTALAETCNFAAPVGTPADGQKLTIRIIDNGTAQSLSFATAAGGFSPIGVTLPTTTVASKYLYIGSIWNAESGFWDVVSIAQQA